MEHDGKDPIDGWLFVALKRTQIMILYSLLEKELKRRAPKSESITQDLLILNYILEKAWQSSDDTSSDESQLPSQSGS